ncbi:sugar phosphate nucleotidyltransferase [Mycoplasmopsis primatum]|uniref:sugar phosphate nucleotidyltransferase n=1 Tax=Mycoplasmopsis primatum TaxID=55604 RepID=UPI00049809D8|nr:sugar phosphate nucleotidyltransferase [Mycoplasmopsis primatum]
MINNILRSKNKIVKNAIILAAGFGSRLVPLTFQKPKGLIKIKNNESMIERQIVFLNSVGIYDITIVVGYMSNAFSKLAKKYNIKLIINREFENSNSLYSLYLARNLLKNTYILNSDAWINKNFFTDKDEYSYLTIVKNKDTENDVYEWKTDIDENQNIKALSPTQLKNNDYFLTGPAYFDFELSKKLHDLLSQYATNNKHKKNSYWEECLFELLLTDKIKAYDQTDNVFEIDNLSDIFKIDKKRKVLNKDVCLKEISSLFHININDIQGIEAIKKGLTNNSFSFIANNVKYVYRLAGKGTAKIIDRKKEQKIYEMIKDFEYAEKLHFYNPKTYSKISYFAQNYKNVDQYNEFEVAQSFKMIKEFHNKKYKLGQEFIIENEIQKYRKAINKSIPMVDKEQELTTNIQQVIKYLKSLNISKILSHIDFYSW